MIILFISIIQYKIILINIYNEIQDYILER